jgi:tetratricopeptide (TPR) repeat protein
MNATARLCVLALFSFLLTACASTPVSGPVWPYPDPPESDGDFGYKPNPSKQTGSASGSHGQQPYATPSPQAREDAQPSASRNPGVQSLVDQADRERAAGELERAAGTLERAIRIVNNDPLPWEKLAELRFEQGNMIQAENLARRSLSFDGTGPTSRNSWLLIADIKRLQGDEAAARTAMANANTR